jgi:hypothetical protein
MGAPMKPREIPFDRCVLPIVNEPTSMRWRLDFADWLAKNGQKARAYWFRRLCDFCENRLSLLETFSSGGFLPDGSGGIEEKILKKEWSECRPDYWQELEGIHQKWYFGRFVFSIVSYPLNLYPKLQEASWLPTAFREGWLESLDCMLLDTEQVRTVLNWPESYRALPLHVDTIRCLPEGFDNCLMQEILSLEGLRSIAIGPEEIAYPCMKRFCEFAKNFRYLQLLGLKKTSSCYRILEQLRLLPELRHLVIGLNLPTDQEIRLLAAIPRLQCLYLCGRDVTDEGLLAVQDIRTLRTLRVSSERITREGIYALREARPDLRVVVIDDARRRLGPV